MVKYMKLFRLKMHGMEFGFSGLGIAGFLINKAAHKICNGLKNFH